MLCISSIVDYGTLRFIEQHRGNVTFFEKTKSIPIIIVLVQNIGSVCMDLQNLFLFP